MSKAQATKIYKDCFEDFIFDVKEGSLSSFDSPEMEVVKGLLIEALKIIGVEVEVIE